jgi:hypothetical protein
MRSKICKLKDGYLDKHINIMLLIMIPKTNKLHALSRQAYQHNVTYK